MRYMGGKSRLAPHLAKVILGSTTERGIYLEPFIGGGAMFARMAPHFDLPIGGDAHTDCALLWQAVAEGWVPPGDVTEGEYATLKHAEPSALRGFVGFGCSFGGKWFGGYARDGKRGNADWSGPRTAYRSVMRGAPLFAGCAIMRGDYAQMDRAALRGVVIYCDPPYAGTTTYTGADGFDHDRFWATAREWSARGAHVFVSEYAAPDDWRRVFERDKTGSSSIVRTGATERLFTHD